MGTFNDGDSGSSIRTKINTAIQKTEGTSAISTIDVDGGAIDGVTIGTNSAVTDLRVDNLKVDGNTISSTDTNGDVTIDPNGTGDVNIGNFKFDADQTVGAGQDNYVLTYDNTGGKISLEAASGGGASLSLYAENAVSETTPTATGDNDVAIGTQAEASGGASIALGFDAVASGNLAFAAVDGTASGASSIAIGSAALAGTASSTIAIGKNTDATGTDALAIGSNAQSSGTESVAIGQSYAAGNGSFAAIIDANTSSFGASSAAANAIAMGYRAKVTASNGISIGRNSSVTSSDSSSIGNGASCTGSSAVALGVSATAEDTNAVAIGTSSKATQKGKIAYACGAFASGGDAQGANFILRRQTTDATASTLSTNGFAGSSTNQIIAASDTCISFHGTVVGMQNGAQAYGSWEIKGMLVNDGGTTSLAVGIVNELALSNASNWVVALSADNTNNALAITVTGEASHNIRWVSNVQTSEVTYA